MIKYVLSIGAGVALGATGVSMNEPGTASIQEIHTLQEAYFQEYGTYLQVLENSCLPHYQRGTVAEKLGKKIPEDCSVDIHLYPDGSQGYDITCEVDGQVIKEKGGAEPTPTIVEPIKPPETATSTATSTKQ